MAEPELIPRRVPVLLGLVLYRVPVGVNTQDYKRHLAHLHRLSLGQQTASPGQGKSAPLRFCVVTYVLINPSISSVKSKLPRWLGTHTHEDFGLQTAVIPAQSGEGALLHIHLVLF